MENFALLLGQVNSFVWGPPLLILLVGTGIYLTLGLGVIQVVRLPLALKYVFSKHDDTGHQGDVSSFAALCTALSATIGTGNIVGVATAVKAGGPGAIFWMWVAAFFGMATKYAEGLLAVKYRVIDANGQMSGGPMYYIERGLNNRLLAKTFALFGIGVAFFGIGTFAQVNAIKDAAHLTFHVPVLVIAGVLTVLVTLVTLGGIKSIARVASRLVPFMATFFILGSVIVLALNLGKIPAAVALIVESAFNPSAALGRSRRHFSYHGHEKRHRPGGFLQRVRTWQCAHCGSRSQDKLVCPPGADCHDRHLFRFHHHLHPDRDRACDDRDLERSFPCRCRPDQCGLQYRA